MEINKSNKCLKTLERVKGIEPSYSAWKAAALPLSYTRIPAMTYHAMMAASTGDRRSFIVKSAVSDAGRAPFPGTVAGSPLNRP
jgi:hypothetical protein